MRTLSTTLIFLILLAGPVLAGEQTMSTPSGWFDFENCVFCKNLIEDPGLLPHCTWENFKIENGAMNIMTIEPAYKESMEKANAAMNRIGMEIQSGKRNPMTEKMCGSCQQWGMLMGSGVEMEQVKGEAAEVTLMTSEDPQLVKRLHELVDRNNEEMAIMMGQDSDHEHDHHH